MRFEFEFPYQSSDTIRKIQDTIFKIHILRFLKSMQFRYVTCQNMC